MKALLLKMNHKNKNGRIYPKITVEEAIQNPIIQEQLATRTFYGSFDPPQATTEIDLEKVSHVITKIFFEGDDVYGDLELLDTPAGRLVKELLESGSTIGLALTGSGNLVYDDKEAAAVVHDLEIHSFNYVRHPSYRED